MVQLQCRHGDSKREESGAWVAHQYGVGNRGSHDDVTGAKPVLLYRTVGLEVAALASCTVD